MSLSFFFLISVFVTEQVFHKEVMQRKQRTALGILRYFGKTVKSLL